MTHRATITLEDEAFRFLQSQCEENRSAYINSLLLREKEYKLKAALIKANQEEASDLVYQKELSSWENTHLDGL